MKKSLAKLMYALCVCSLYFVAGCGSNPQIAIGLASSGGASLAAGQSTTITATVTHDSSNKGVTFTLSPSTGAGMLSGATSTSVTYTAPATIPSATTVTITATSVARTTRTTTITINLLPVSIALAPAGPQTLEQNQNTSPSPITATVSNDPSNKGVTWSLAGAGAISGQTATTVIYKAPASITAASTATVTATSAADTTKTQALTINLVPPPSVTTTTLPQGTVATAYTTTTLAATGGVSPYSWTLTTAASTFPTGLTLSSAGVISGTPTAFGTFNFTVQVKDANNFTASANLSIKINPAPVTVTTMSLPNGIVNASYSATLMSTGGAPPITWAVTAGSLPTGLMLNPATGAITGTPLTAGTSNFTVTATDSSTPALTNTKALSITIIPLLSITTTSLPNGITSTAYSATLAASGGVTPVMWSVTIGTLPAGLTLNAATGAIAGMPTTAGTSSFTVQAADSGTPQQKVTKAFTITIIQQLVISTPAALPTGSVTTPYSVTLASSGGTGAVTWAQTGGTLPGGLTLTSAGVLAGTPTTANTYNFSITATDSGVPPQTATVAFTLTITPVLAITTTSPLPSAFVGTFYSHILATNGGGIAPITWSITLGSLPPGVTLTASTGRISGTPSTSLTGTFNFTVQAADSGTPQQTSTKALSISVSTAPLSVATMSLPDGVVGQNYTGAMLQTAGGNPPVTWTISSGSLPTWATLNASTGAITGTPTTAATTTFTVMATDSTAPTAQTATKQLSIRVNTVLTVTTTSLTGATLNTPYSVTLASSGGVAPITWSITVGSLPPGLTLVQSTGVISGTPNTTSGSPFNFTVQATDSTSPTPQTATQPLSITVTVATLVIGTTTLPNGAVGTAYNQTLMATGGTPPVNWSITTGTLPAGLMLTASTGVISGTPTAPAGTANFTVKATDSTTPTAMMVTQALSITITTGGALTCPLPTLGMEGLLANGNIYGARFNGWKDPGQTIFNATASFTTNGAGVIPSGVADANGVGQTPTVGLAMTAGCYNLGTDLRGKMIWNFGPGNTVTFAIAVRSDGQKGKFIEFDDTSGTSGTRGSGEFRKQDPAALNVSTLNGPFAFAIAGDDANQNRVGVIGVATFNSGALTLSSGSIDVSVSGGSQANIPVTGSFTAPDAHGRGTLTLMFTVFIGMPPVATPVTETFAYYIVHQTNEIFLQTTNAPDATGGHIAANGVAIAQIVPTGGFTPANSLNAPVVFSLTGLDVSHGAATNTAIGMVNSTTPGSFTGIIDQNADAPNPSTFNVPISGTITVQANGLGVITVTSPAGLVPTSVAVVAPNFGFLLEGAGTGSAMAGNDVQIGHFEAQTVPTGGFTTSSITGNFFFGSDEPGSGFVSVQSGVFTVGSPGNFTAGTSDQSGISGTSSNSIMATYTMTSNGRGVITGNGGNTLILWIIKASKRALVMDTTQSATTQNVTIFNVEQ